MKFFKKFILIISILFMGIFFSACDSGKKEIHHAFPQQFRGYFDKAGLDIDKYGIELTREFHRGTKSLHNSAGKEIWNKTWKEFFIKNSNPSKNKIMTKLEDMLKNQGFTGSISFVNYRTKQATGAGMIVTNSWFLKFAGFLGKWLINMLSNSDLGNSIIAVLAFWGSEILAKFGIMAGHPVTVGVGLIAAIVVILMVIGLFYLSIWWGLASLILLTIMLPTL